MKVAVVGSRGLHVEDLGRYLPADTTEIVSGGAVGVDTSAREYALAHGLLLTEFRPDLFPLRTQCALAPQPSDCRLCRPWYSLFWDGSSHGTPSCAEPLPLALSKPHRLFSPAKLGQVKSE